MVESGQFEQNETNWDFLDAESNVHRQVAVFHCLVVGRIDLHVGLWVVALFELLVALCVDHGNGNPEKERRLSRIVEQRGLQQLEKKLHLLAVLSKATAHHPVHLLVFRVVIDREYGIVPNEQCVFSQTEKTFGPQVAVFRPTPLFAHLACIVQHEFCQLDVLLLPRLFALQSRYVEQFHQVVEDTKMHGLLTVVAHGGPVDLILWLVGNLGLRIT